MGYCKKGTIRRMIIAGVLVFSLTCCGSASVNVDKQVPQNESANTPNNTDNMKPETEKEISETPEPAPETTTVVSCNSERPLWDIPVYSAEEKEEVKRYLGQMPDKYLPYKEIEERGIIQRIWRNSKEDKKQQKKFDKQWLNFYQDATRKDLKWNVKKGEAYHDLAFKQAVVILNYTVEGDPVYDYISCINGDYYYYSDNSRDEYGNGSAYNGSYKDLRAITEKGENGKEYTSFYLVKTREMTDEEIKKMIQSEKGYDIKEIAEVYSLDYKLKND